MTLVGKEPSWQCRRHRRPRLDPWVGKISWRRKWQSTPVFLPGESHGQRSQWATVHGVTKTRTQLKQLSTYVCCCYSVTQPCPVLCNPMDCCTPSLPVPHHLPEFVQVHVHCISDAVQPSHPRTHSSSSAFNLSQHQGLFQ